MASTLTFKMMFVPSQDYTHLHHHEIFRGFQRRRGAFVRGWSIGCHQLHRLTYSWCLPVQRLSYVPLYLLNRSVLTCPFTVDLGIASDAYEKAKAFVAPLNVTQKIAIVMASDFTSDNASWTAYTNTDGVDGINFYYYVSGFCMGNALTQTWNRDLIEAQFKAVGEEYFGTGHNMVDGALLGPLGRVPQGL